jgi:hypothetical protein
VLASMTERIRRAFGLRPRATSNRWPELVRLQTYLQETCGGAVAGCPCGGGLITPVVNVHPHGLEFAALACTACHEVRGLTEPGWLVGECEASAPTETIH